MFGVRKIICDLVGFCSFVVNSFSKKLWGKKVVLLGGLYQDQFLPPSVLLIIDSE